MYADEKFQPALFTVKLLRSTYLIFNEVISLVDYNSVRYCLQHLMVIDSRCNIIITVLDNYNCMWLYYNKN